MPGYCDDERRYIDAVRDYTLPDEIIYTEALSSVMTDIIDGHREIIFSGPKGCGKSIIAAVLFLILSKDCCVYLTQHSYEYIEHVRELYQGRKMADPFMYVRNLLNQRKYLILDFGTAPTDASSLRFMLNAYNIFGQFTKVIALSSGYNMAEVNPRFKLEIRKLYYQISVYVEQRSFNPITITGFTNDEATTFIEHCGTKLDKGEITKLGGTNPLLLSLAPSCETINQYSVRVQRRMQVFLTQNLPIFSDVKSFSDYFNTCNWEVGRLYIYLVLQDQQFTSKQLEDYEDTWLCMNHLLIDVDDKKKKFNFPGLGKLLVSLMRKFLPEVPNVQQLALTNHSVGGFVCKQQFISYIHQCQTLLIVVKSLQNSKEPICLNLSFTGSLCFEGDDFMKGILYELYAFHPAIDFVGYLKSDSCDVLVCLQISLSSYAKHSAKLSDVIRHSPRKYLREGEEPSVSLLQFYSSRAAPLFIEGGKPSVLFLYLSPLENERLIPHLQEEIMTTLKQASHSFDFYVGVVATNSLPFFLPYQK